MIEDEETYIDGVDVPAGIEVRWYHGGIARREQRTVSADEATAGFLALTYPAEFGSVVGTVGGTVRLMGQYQVDGETRATDASGTAAVRYAGLAAGDVVVLDYIDSTAVPLTHIATGSGVATTATVDTAETAVDNRATKIRRTGAAARVASLEEIWYNDLLLAAFFGDLVTTEDEGSLWTDDYRTTKIVPVLVGKWVVDGTLRKKYFLLGCQATSIAQTLATEAYYRNRFELLVEHLRVYTPAEEQEMTIDIANVTISGAKSWNGQRIYDVVIEGDVKQVLAATAGEDQGAYDCVYLETNGRMYKTDADTDAKSNGVLAIALAATLNGAAGQYLLHGPVTNPGWNWIVGRPVYLSQASGGLTQTAPVVTGTQIRIVGYATAATTLHFAPDSTVLEV
jgi:hypothetical protein